MKNLLFSSSALCVIALSLCSCGVTKAPQPEKGDEAAQAVAPKAQPTPAQRASAQKVIAEQKALQEEEEILLNTPAAPAEEEEATTPRPTLSTGGLRMRRFAPPEEAVSSAEGTEMPLPNAAELHGLRSPELKGGNLPMDINGKINPTPETQE